MKLGGLCVGGRLDRYVALLFAGSYATALLLIVGLFLVIDMASNLDEYLRPGRDGPSPSMLDIGRYYMLHVPFLYLQVAPFVTLVAGLFTAARLVRDNEVVAALSAGVPSPRLLAPVLCAGALLAVSMFGLRELASETLGERRHALKDYLEERRAVPEYSNLRLKDEAGDPVFVARFVPASAAGPATIEGLEITLPTERSWVNFQAERATWDASAATWHLVNGRREEIDALAQRREPIEELPGIRFEPGDVFLAWKSREDPLDLSFRESFELAIRDPDNTLYQTQLHYHLSFPLANLVLLLVGMPFLVRMERGQGTEGIAAGFVLCVFYFGADFFARSLGISGQLDPLLACWTPLMFFGALGAVLFGSMRS